jgi:hypothetical protein
MRHVGRNWTYLGDSTESGKGTFIGKWEDSLVSESFESHSEVGDKRNPLSQTIWYESLRVSICSGQGWKNDWGQGMPTDWISYWLTNGHPPFSFLILSYSTNSTTSPKRAILGTIAYFGVARKINCLILLDFCLVEAGGVEPPSENIPLKRLHT